MSPNLLILAASLCLFLAVASAAWLAQGFLTQPARAPAPQGAFETARRQKLRDGSMLYRWFEPGVDRLARWNGHGRLDRLEQLRRSLVLAREPLPATPEEALALMQLESAFAATAGALIGLLLVGNAFAALAFGLVAGFLYQRLLGNRVVSRAQQRLAAIKRRLPFSIDLMTLMMEAGAGFQEALATAVREARGHPFAEEFEQVLRDVELGRPRRDALVALQQRLGDDDVTELIFAITKGEELGTPLGQILRTQAEQMHLKRSQWAEKASAEAQVNIVFPGMVIMIACLAIVTAPFVLGALFAQ